MSMQHFDEIQNLWLSNNQSELPDAKEIFLQIKRTRRKMIRRNVLGALTLCLTFIFIGFIGWYYHFERWTTRVGIIITLLTIILGIGFNSRLLQLLSRQGDTTLSNKEFLGHLIHFRKARRAIHLKGMALYFILLTIGIVLYMVEFAERNLIFGIIAYTITLGWIAFSWIYFNKKRGQEQEQEINKQIENLKRLLEGIEGG